MSCRKTGSNGERNSGISGTNTSEYAAAIHVPHGVEDELGHLWVNIERWQCDDATVSKTKSLRPDEGERDETKLANEAFWDFHKTDQWGKCKLKLPSVKDLKQLHREWRRLRDLAHGMLTGVRLFE